MRVAEKRKLASLRKAAARLEGLVVLRVELNEFSDGRGGFACKPVLYFTDGTRLTFWVRETEQADYGVEPHVSALSDPARICGAEPIA